MTQSIRERTIKRLEQMLAKERDRERRRILEMLLEQEHGDKRWEKANQHNQV